MNSQKLKLRTALLLFLSVVTLGIMGFHFLANYSFVDALYMTIITVSTVGFGEIHPLDETTRLFTIFLILASISIYGYLVSVFTEFISNDQLMKEIKEKSAQKKIHKLKDHTIVCGYGRNGAQAIEKLKNFKKSCVVIEKKPENLELLRKNHVHYIEGDATDDLILQKAGIECATSLIATLPSDADNLYVVLSARQLNKKIKIVSRSIFSGAEKKLLIAGANHIIMPDKLGGEYMASILVTPDLVEFVKNISFEGHKTANLEEIAVNDLPEEFLGKSIRDLDVRKNTGCNVVGYITDEGAYIINPDAETTLNRGENLIVLGRPEQIAKITNFILNPMS